MGDVFEARRAPGQRAVRGRPLGQELLAERSADAGPEGAIRSLQETAGNRAVASLFGAVAGPVAQRQAAPDDEKPAAAQNDTDLLVPADEGGPAPVSASGGGAAGAAQAGTSPGGSSPGGTAAAGGAGPSFEGALFAESVVKPLQATIDVVKTDPPDAEVAVKNLRNMGPTLVDYEERYRGKDEGIANHLFAVRGWLGGPYRELERRLGKDRPQSDKEIANSLVETQVDTNEIASQLGK